jgi:rod shape-determining protein MreD
MSILISFPIVFLLILLQTTLARQFTLLNGSVDLLLIWIAAWAMQSKDDSSWWWAILSGAICAFVSAIPWYVCIITYLAVVILSRTIRKILWQSPLLSMFSVTIVGSIILYILSFVGLQATGIDYPWQDSLVRIIIPSVFLNLFLAIPVYAVVKDTARWVFKTEVES